MVLQNILFLRTNFREMLLPTDKTVHQDEIAFYWIEDELLCTISKSSERTVDNIKRSFQLIEQLTRGKKICILSDISAAGYHSELVRSVTADLSARQFKAMAMVSDSSYGKLVGNTFISLSGLTIPARLFAYENEARKWLECETLNKTNDLQAPRQSLA